MVTMMAPPIHLSHRIGWTKREMRDMWADFFRSFGLPTRKANPGTFIDPEEGEDGDGETYDVSDFGVWVEAKVASAWVESSIRTKASGLHGAERIEFRKAELRQLLQGAIRG